MNSGKSTALCALAPGAAIVDETPGTTADVKVALAEGHGENLGPLKLMDSAFESFVLLSFPGSVFFLLPTKPPKTKKLTSNLDTSFSPLPPLPEKNNQRKAAGVDESGVLGAKKREKAFRALRESDVAVVVVDGASGCVRERGTTEGRKRKREKGKKGGGRKHFSRHASKTTTRGRKNQILRPKLLLPRWTHLFLRLPRWLREFRRGVSAAATATKMEKTHSSTFPPPSKKKLTSTSCRKAGGLHLR
jgi:hypothetical protein